MRPHTYDLDSLGWTPALAAAFEPHASAGLVAGRIGGEHRGRFVVYLERGERLAEPSGRLRRNHPAEWPAVGDWVACRLPRGDGPTVIDSVLPRTTAFQQDAADPARRGASRPHRRAAPSPRRQPGAAPPLQEQARRVASRWR